MQYKLILLAVFVLHVCPASLTHKFLPRRTVPVIVHPWDSILFSCHTKQIASFSKKSFNPIWTTGVNSISLKHLLHKTMHLKKIPKLDVRCDGADTVSFYWCYFQESGQTI